MVEECGAPGPGTGGQVYHVTDTTTPSWGSALVQEVRDGPWYDDWGHDMAFTVTHNPDFSYLFYDGFESGDSSAWSAAHLQ